VEGPVAGSANQVIYKDGTNDATGSSNFTFNESTNELTLLGTLSATTKSFLIKHPSKDKEGMLLRYSSLESPFHGVRLSGKGKLENGKCVVSLPEYLKDLVLNADDNNLSVQLTSYRDNCSLFVESINVSENNFVVSCDHKNFHEFFWTFTATRSDVEPLVVEF
jgi:hypothetical protein